MYKKRYGSDCFINIHFLKSKQTLTSEQIFCFLFFVFWIFFFFYYIFLKIFIAGYRLEASDELSLSEFMQVFDKDRDGSVDHREFVDFMSGLMKLERDEVVAQGELGITSFNFFNWWEI